MQITEQEISWLLLGVAIGSLATYWITTKEKRIISQVRDRIVFYAHYVELSPAQHRKCIIRAATEELLSDGEVLRIYGRARQLKNPAGQRYKDIDPISLAALTIICEEMLGLSGSDALRALLKAKRADELRALLPADSG